MVKGQHTSSCELWPMVSMRRVGGTVTPPWRFATSQTYNMCTRSQS